MRIGPAVFLGGFLIIAATGSARACSCGRNPMAAGLLESSAAVFTGVAQSTVAVEPGISMTTFKVTEGFKGVRTGRLVRVRHRSGSSASCGIRFALGEAHTLSAGGGAAGFSANLCSAWMFLPQVGLGADLIAQMRALRRR